MDWAKTFESVDPACSAISLLRFGIPQQIVSIIGVIYTDRLFYVTDAWSESDLHPQFSGISQGCPLSPFLFIILMTVLMHDAKQDLQTVHGVDLSSSYFVMIYYMRMTLYSLILIVINYKVICNVLQIKDEPMVLS